jgi:hypothetical protein
MTNFTYKAALVFIAVSFTLFFAVTILPPLIENFDVFGAIAAGFVNPFASGYSTGVILCWCVLASWVFHEAKTHSTKHGWVCLVLGLVPGVVVGFSLYLILRHYHFTPSTNPDA